MTRTTNVTAASGKPTQDYGPMLPGDKFLPVEPPRNEWYEYVIARQAEDKRKDEEARRNPPPFNPYPRLAVKNAEDLYDRFKRLHDEFCTRRNTPSLYTHGLPGQEVENYTIRVLADGVAEIAEAYAKALRQTKFTG